MEDIHAREIAIESHDTKVAEIEAKLLKLEQEGKYQIRKDMHEFREQIVLALVNWRNNINTLIKNIETWMQLSQI